MIELTKGQLEGVKLGKKWYKSATSKQLFQIGGYAGTGKTTMVYSLIDALGIDMDDVAFATYTGKAALVLTIKGCSATTIHQLIYKPYKEEEALLDKNGNPIINANGKELSNEKITFVKKDSLPENIKLIVLDECSMIDEEMLEDLKSFGIPIIVLGDPFQLPPIGGKPVLLQEIDVMLTEIMRQKEGDPIVYLSFLARKYRLPKVGKYGISHVLPRWKLDNDIKTNYGEYDKLLTSASTIICRTNRSRNMLNRHIRENVYGLTKKFPTMGDKVICRRNNWNLKIKDELELYMVNGLMGKICSPITTENIHMDECYLNVDFKPEMCKEDYFENIPITGVPFMDIEEETAKIIDAKQYKYFKKKDKICNKFEYAYAITDYLAQGSSYSKVLIYDEHYGERENYFKSLYTSITRAEDQVIVLLQNAKKYF